MAEPPAVEKLTADTPDTWGMRVRCVVDGRVMTWRNEGPPKRWYLEEDPGTTWTIASVLIHYGAEIVPAEMTATKPDERGPRHMVENTAQRDPMVHLAGAIIEGTDAYIRGMEADGQKQVTGSDVMPAEAPWDELEALGFIRGLPVPGDEMFVHATLPDGWAKRGTGHSMWSEVVDERGVGRVAVFYKAAFYDRHAHANIIDAGADLATRILYGDGPVALPAAWDQLTTDELDSFWSAVDRMVGRITKDPETYGEYQPRVDALLTCRLAAPQEPTDG